MPTIIFPPGVTPTRHFTTPPDTSMRIYARLTSLDNGMTMWFWLAPSEHERNYAAQWDEADVCEADVEPSEYRHTVPETRIYHLTLDAYGRPGGIVNSLESELKLLKSFTKRAPGKVRSHRCIYSQGEQSFGPCFVERVGVAVKRINATGGALQAYDVTLELKELQGNVGGIFAATTGSF